MNRISTITGLPVRKYTKKVREVIKEVPKNLLKVEDFKRYNGAGNYYDLKHATISSRYGNVRIYISGGPTLNCQMAVAGAFGNFLKSADNMVEQLKIIKEHVRKNILLVDIKDSYMEYFNKKIPKELIIMISPYKSTNGSNMNICLINMKNL